MGAVTPLMKPAADDKVCPHCKEQKSLQFFRTRPGRNNLRIPVAYCKPCQNKLGNQWARKRGKKRDRVAEGLWTRHKMRWADYIQMAVAQEHVCALCLRNDRGRLQVDHNHQTGEKRGLLCDPCNRALGILGDNVERLERVVAYLRGE